MEYLFLSVVGALAVLNVCQWCHSRKLKAAIAEGVDALLVGLCGVGNEQNLSATDRIRS